MVMSPENRALCYFYRNPPPGGEQQKPMAWAAIARLVWNVDGKTHPTPDAVRKCVVAWRRKKEGSWTPIGLEENDRSRRQEDHGGFP